MTSSFEEFEGYKSFDDLIGLNLMLEQRVLDIFNDNDIEPGNDYCVGILGSEVRNENLCWDTLELIVFTKNINEFIISADCYKLKEAAGRNNSDFNPDIEVKSSLTGFKTIFIDNTIDNNARVDRLMSPDRLLTSKVIVGNPQIRFEIAKDILLGSINNKIIKGVRSYIVACEKICSQGFQKRSGEKIVHINYEEGFIHFNGETHRGVKESTIRGIQNLLVLKELKYCKGNIKRIEKILSFPNDIVSRINHHFEFLNWFDSSDKDELVSVYKRSIELQNECTFTNYSNGFILPYSRITISEKDIEMIQRFAITLKKLRVSV